MAPVTAGTSRQSKTFFIRFRRTEGPSELHLTTGRLPSNFSAVVLSLVGKIPPPNQGLQAAFGQTSRRPPGGRRYAGWVKVEVTVT